MKSDLDILNYGGHDYLLSASALPLEEQLFQPHFGILGKKKCWWFMVEGWWLDDSSFVVWWRLLDFQTKIPLRTHFNYSAPTSCTFIPRKQVKRSIKRLIRFSRLQQFPQKVQTQLHFFSCFITNATSSSILSMFHSKICCYRRRAEKNNQHYTRRNPIKNSTRIDGAKIDTKMIHIEKPTLSTESKVKRILTWNSRETSTEGKEEVLLSIRCSYRMSAMKIRFTWFQRWRWCCEIRLDHRLD